MALAAEEPPGSKRGARVTKGHGDVDVSGSSGGHGPEGPQDEVEFGCCSARAMATTTMPMSTTEAFHDLLRRSGRAAIALHGDDEDHQGKGAARSVDGSIVVQHLVDDGNHAGGHGHHHEIEARLDRRAISIETNKSGRWQDPIPSSRHRETSESTVQRPQEHGHGGVGGDTPPETGVPAVSAKKSVVPKVNSRQVWFAHRCRWRWATSRSRCRLGSPNQSSSIVPVAYPIKNRVPQSTPTVEKKKAMPRK